MRLRSMALPLLPQLFMGRRVGAVIAILLVVGLLGALVWGVYQHHQAMHEPDDSATVRLDVPRPSSVVNFAPRFC